MSQLSLVTGAAGHLGNNLVRTLLSHGEKVRASIRNPDQRTLFETLDCELVFADMCDAPAMEKAMQDVDVLYHVAAVFKHWAKNPEKDIVQANIRGTEVVLNAAAKAGVKKVVYVSSVAAVGHDGSHLDESHWNQEQDNAYYRSKILSEQGAWALAKELGLDMVSVLPSAMIGPHCERLTDTMDFLEQIRTKRLPFDPNFHFNFVDVRDVAEGLYLASLKGKNGERYILANQSSSSMTALSDWLTLRYKPKQAPRWLLFIVAWCAERISRLSGRPAALLVSQVRLFFGVKQEFNISKAKKELGFTPRSPEQAIREAFQYLDARSLRTMS